MTVYGMDVSNYTAVPDITTLKAFCESERLERILIGCQFIDTFNAWNALAKQLGLRVEAWLYLYNIGSRYNPSNLTYAQQVTNNLAQLPFQDITTYWLDVEDTDAQLPSESTISDALHAVSIDAGIYTGAWYWPTIGNPQLGRQTKLWVENYDNNPEDFRVNFGGWLRATVKQYKGNYTSYGMTVDLDSWDE